MGKAPRGEGINVRFSDVGVAKLDEFKGAWTRSEYIRQAVARAVQQGLRGPEEVKWE